MPAAEPTTDQPTEPTGADEPDSSRLDPAAPDPGDRVHVSLALLTPDTDPPLTGWLDARFAEAARLSGVSTTQVTLVVVHDSEMARLHEQYTGVAGTTDVLTFDLTASADGATPEDALAEDAHDVGLEADIVLCLDEAERQAAERGHPVQHELLLYAVHGLMHLLGEDDHDERAYQQMHAREDALLSRMGLGPLFHPDSEP